MGSEYGLQIISHKNVGEGVTLGGDTWEEAKGSYNGAIEKLNNEAEKYINTAYAYDGRCVGSIPTVGNGMFVDKNKVRDNEGNILDKLSTVTLPMSNWNTTVYQRPTDWTSDDTGCYKSDMNYIIDEKKLKEEGVNIWNIEENYWLASHNVDSRTALVYFNVRYVNANGIRTGNCTCYVYDNGNIVNTSHTYGLRPCISLKANEIKITSGDGKSEATAYTIGK